MKPYFDSVSYTLQGEAWGGSPGFWEPGYGEGFMTRNLGEKIQSYKF